MNNKFELVRTRIPNKVIGALADQFQRSSTTIIRWFIDSDDRLTSDKAKEVYRTEGFTYDSSGLESGLQSFEAVKVRSKITTNKKKSR